MNKNPDIALLNEYNRQQKEKNVLLVKNTLDRLLASSQEISIAELARESGVSRSTIYRDAELRELIDRYRQTSVLRRNRKVKYEKEAAKERSAQAKLNVVLEQLKKERKLTQALREENVRLKEHIERLNEEQSNVRKLRPDTPN